MNRIINRLKLIFVAVFATLSVGFTVYHVGWVWPEKECEARGDWWDWRTRTCARPVLISDITGRMIDTPEAREAAKADAARRKLAEAAAK
jgi:hypothetical protein